MIDETEVRRLIDEFADGLEDRLAVAFRKALDTSYTELEERLKSLEGDVAVLQRHTGLRGGEES